jgi:hypothetical protein
MLAFMIMNRKGIKKALSPAQGFLKDSENEMV